jgi:hypothetical protein
MFKMKVVDRKGRRRGLIFLRNPKSLDFDRQDGNKAASTPNQKAQLWTKWRCVFVTFDRGWDADADNFIKMNASIKKRPYGVMRPVRPHFTLSASRLRI